MYFDIVFIFLSSGPSGMVSVGGKENTALSYDVTSGSEITPCNKINKPHLLHKSLVVRF